MKKYILLLAAVGLMSSCYDLDQFPHDKLSSGTFWKTEDQAHQGLISIYAALRNDNTFGAYYAQDAMSEIAGDYNNWLYPTIIKGTYTYETGTVVNRWTNCYEGIARANVLLQNIDNVEMSDEQKIIYKSEAKFLRALYYFHLMNFFGGVPLYDETTVISDQFMQMKNPRSTIEETRQFILDDLEESITNLPIHWEANEYGRVTRGAAVALRGKVKLYNKDYIGAADDFEEIVKDPQNRGYGYALNPSYPELFKVEGEACNEMIFTIPVSYTHLTLPTKA